LNNYKSNKDILKHLSIGKFDINPLYDFVPLEGNKLKCFIKLKDLTISEFVTSRNKNVALKILIQRTFKKLFPFSYGKIYNSGQDNQSSSISNLVSKPDSSDLSEICSKQNKSEINRKISEDETSQIHISDSNSCNILSKPDKDFDLNAKLLEEPEKGAWNFSNFVNESNEITPMGNEDPNNNDQDFLKKKRLNLSPSPEMIDLSSEEGPSEVYKNLAIDDKMIVTDYLTDLKINPYSVLF
jgi:hypothetical protein